MFSCSLVYTLVIELSHNLQCCLLRLRYSSVTGVIYWLCVLDSIWKPDLWDSNQLLETQAAGVIWEVSKRSRWLHKQPSWVLVNVSSLKDRRDKLYIIRVVLWGSFDGFFWCKTDIEYWHEEKRLFNLCRNVLLVLYSDVPVLFKDSMTALNALTEHRGSVEGVQRAFYTGLTSMISSSHSTSVA